MKHLAGLTLLFGMVALYSGHAWGRTTTCTSLSELQRALKGSTPGDVIILADGEYFVGSPILVSCTGTASQPIRIKAATVGGAVIMGDYGFQIEVPASHVVIEGFVFTHNSGEVEVGVGATHCAFYRNIFRCRAAGRGNKPYLTIYGDATEIAFNTFEEKDTEGCMLTVQGPGKSGMAQQTWIHHNHFRDFKPSHANNSSAIQLGLSSRSLTSAHALVEYNLFEDCKGENEGVICNKSSDNVYRYNTFGKGCREVSIRHGDRMQVYGNFFIGCSGLRFSGDAHQIYSNYFQDCDVAIYCTNGDGDVHGNDDLKSHDRPDGVQIAGNTLVNNRVNFTMPGRTGGLGATGIVFANNIVYGGAPPVIEGPYIDPVWEGNVLWQSQGGAMPGSGYTIADPGLQEEDGMYPHIKASSLARNAVKGNHHFIIHDIDGASLVKKQDVGADEYGVSGGNRPLSVKEVGVSGARSGSM
jgi:poly(beta-D-mannuronate) lyase